MAKIPVIFTSILSLLLILRHVARCDNDADSTCKVTQWTTWSVCSQPCGNAGESTRARTITQKDNKNICHYDTIEWKGCNRICNNQGTPHATGCNCRRGTSGRCCEKGAPVAVTTVGPTNNKGEI